MGHIAYTRSKLGKNKLYCNS